MILNLFEILRLQRLAVPIIFVLNVSSVFLYEFITSGCVLNENNLWSNFFDKIFEFFIIIYILVY